MAIWSMTSEQHGAGLKLHQLTLGYISSGLVPPPHAVSPDLVVVTAPRAIDLVGLPSSTTINQDVPSASTSPTNLEIQSQDIHQGVEERINGNQNAQLDNAPLLHNL
ncbi:hypothetical protein Tco_1091981 [Tanacetum coccineum]|uniref:Uncharacterized protein n=1 Tax=Tanacetum coccineum TaxID=301880 RepID=A0ABQ5I8Q0_9ASTR